MNAPTPDDFSEELLAAYADGELNAADRERVERWLASHPEAMDEVRNQQELSASNAALWDVAGPPEPSSGVWSTVRQEIEMELSPPPPVAGWRPRTYRTVGWVLGGLAASGIAAAIGWLALTSTPQKSVPENRTPVELAHKPKTEPEVAPLPRIVGDSFDPFTAVAVLAMPTDDEVVLDRIPNMNDGWLPIGRHPIPGTLTLASVDDVYLEEGPKMTMGPGDAPMIFAAKQR